MKTCLCLCDLKVSFILYSRLINHKSIKKMREWFKKYLGWLGFGIWMTCTLLFVLDEFMLKNTIPINEELLMIGF